MFLELVRGSVGFIVLVVDIILLIGRKCDMDLKLADCICKKESLICEWQNERNNIVKTCAVKSRVKISFSGAARARLCRQLQYWRVS